jgi:NhaP-type Na+/H+ or K+/H+ antiporter
VDPLYLIAGVVAVGVLVLWIAARLQLPAIVLLLATGLLAGPVLGWLDPRALFGELLRPFVSLGVGFVLFEGGLSLRLREVRRLGRPIFALVLGGLVLTFALASVLAHRIAGLSWATSAVIASVLVVTGPTVIRPMLRHARLARRPALLLKWEGIVNDPLGALLAVIVLEAFVALSSVHDARHSLGAIPLQVVTAGLFGLFAGLAFARMLDRGWIPEHLKTPAIVGGVVAVFAGAEALYDEAGLLGVTVMGVVLANVGSPNVESIRHFKEDVTTLLVSSLFLVLSASLRHEDLRILSVPLVLFVLAVVFVVRPLAVWGALYASGLPWREKLLIGWIAPRGVVAAAMGAALAPRLADAGYADADRLVPVLFGVILTTVVLHGVTVRPLAKRLGLAHEGAEGVLLVGAANWVVELARALGEAGTDAVVVHSDYRQTTRARVLGVEAAYGEILDEDTLDELPLERLSWALACTSDDSYNALVCVSLHKVFGRERVLQLASAKAAEEEAERPLRGRAPWGAEATFSRISSLYWAGRRFRATTLTEQFGWNAFRERNPDALALFTAREGRLAPVEPDQPVEPGVDLVYLG